MSSNESVAPKKETPQTVVVKAYFDRGISTVVVDLGPDADPEDESLLCDIYSYEGIFEQMGGAYLENIEVYDEDDNLIFDLNSLEDDERDEIYDDIGVEWKDSGWNDLKHEGPLAGYIDISHDFVMTCRINCAGRFDIRKLKLIPEILAEWSRDGDDGYVGFMYDGQFVASTDWTTASGGDCEWDEIDRDFVKKD